MVIREILTEWATQQPRGKRRSEEPLVVAKQHETRQAVLRYWSQHPIGRIGRHPPQTSAWRRRKLRARSETVLGQVELPETMPKITDWTDPSARV